MKIRLDELRERYVSCITDRTSVNRKNCPSPEEINDCLRGSATKRKKNHLVEHITRCSFCLEEFRFVLEARRQETELIKGIEKRYGLPSFRNGKFKEKNAEYFRFRRKILPFFVKKMRLTAAITAVVLLAVAGTLYFSLNKKQSFRTPKQQIIKPIHPVNKKVIKTSLLFRWKKQEGAEYYIFELFDETLFPLWKSPKILNNFIQLPPPVADKLSPGSTCFWFVTGFSAQGQKTESPLTPFFIKK
jgi:hypothetical protein